MNDNLCDLTIENALKGLSKHDFSSLDLVNSCLAQIEKYDPAVQAFISVSEESAKTEAQKADKLILADKNCFDKYPLLGIPFSAKDIYNTKSFLTTAGSELLKDFIPPYSASMIEKLIASGAICLGKTNCDAWAHGASGENSDFFPAKNPWNLEKTPGGSSSGSAVSVSSGEAFFSTASDTGGSIRLPSSFCNIVGIKPTYGRVSRYGVIAMASSLDTMGHMAKTVYDSAYIFNITAGSDIKDATSADNKPGDYLENIDKCKKLNIGLPKEYFAKSVDGEIKSAVFSAVKTLEKQGHNIIEVSLPHTDLAVPVYYIIQPAEVSSNLARYDGVRFGKTRENFGNEAKRRIMLGTYALSSGYYDAYYKKAMQVRTLLIKDFTTIFEKTDMLLAPVSPSLPFDIGEKSDDPLKMYMADVLTAAINLSGLPSLALPCGFSKSGLPIGMQIIGKYFQEIEIYKLGFQYQRLTDWHKRKPKIE